MLEVDTDETGQLRDEMKAIEGSSGIGYLAFTSQRQEMGMLIKMAKTLLAYNELRKATSFLRDTDRDSYLAAHTLKRLLIAKALNKAIKPDKKWDARDLLFGETIYGKPTLKNCEIEVDLSISHTTYAVAGLVIVGTGIVCGVDIEEIFKKKLEVELEEKIYTQREIKSMNIGNPEKRRVTQTVNWTRKEAVLKLTGLGLSLPMKRIGFMKDGTLESENLIPDWVRRESIRVSTKIKGNYCISFATGKTVLAAFRQEGDCKHLKEEGVDASLRSTQVSTISVDQLFKGPGLDNKTIIHNKNIIS